VDARFVTRFAIRRAIRLDPPYWMSIALFITLAYISQFFVPGKSFHFPDVKVLAAHLLYLQEILQLKEINTVYWTLCLEIQFYLIFCFLMYLAHRFRRDDADRRSLHAIFVPAALLASFWPLRVIPTNPWPGLFLEMWYGFLIGVAACWAMQKVIPIWWFYAYAGLLGVGGIRYLDSSVVTCVSTAVLLTEAARRGKLAVWFNLPALLFLGMISYSLYLIHNPVTGAFYRVAYKITGRSLVAEAIWFIPMIAMNITCAFGFWWLFERTSQALSRHVSLGEASHRKRPQATVPALMASLAHRSAIYCDPAQESHS
jgi:peptidoglycan/LPS O-acetylase OafA/YrhL